MKVYSYVLKIVKNVSVAEEISQETFLKIMTSRAVFQGNSSEYTYLCAIAKNLCYDYFREEKKKNTLSMEERFPSEDRTLDEITTTETTLSIHMILHEMDEPYKKVFELRVFGELSFAEIAMVFQKTENWARVTYYRARLKLKEKLDKETFMYQLKKEGYQMKKVKIGVLGGYRGSAMIKYCKLADHAEVVAICDKSSAVIESQKKLAEGYDITFYDNFDEFIEHDMDAVVLANYANSHAPFAIKALKKGKHVYSEVLPCQTLKEAVELIEAVEETGKIYAYGENFCYMASTSEMRKLYHEDKIGDFEYGECEYIHNCEPRWHQLTYGEPDHWRNNMYSTFYCTHSLGPIIHATGLRPVSVIGIESTKNERNMRMGSKSGQFAIEMVTLENGGIIKSVHGGLYKDSYWYCMYGSKGYMECTREILDDLPPYAGCHRAHTYELHVNCDAFPGDYGKPIIEHYYPDRGLEDKAQGYDHGGGDFYSMWHFVEKILGNPKADTIDVYEALDMFLPGKFAYMSILNGSVPTEIPNFREKSVRDQWRNDTSCTDPHVAGDMLLPTRKDGTPKIDDEVYAIMKKRWEESVPLDY